MLGSAYLLAALALFTSATYALPSAHSHDMVWQSWVILAGSRIVALVWLGLAIAYARRNRWGICFVSPSALLVLLSLTDIPVIVGMCAGAGLCI